MNYKLHNIPHAISTFAVLIILLTCPRVVTCLSHTFMPTLNAKATELLNQWQSHHPTIMLEPFCTSYASKNYNHLYQSSPDNDNSRKNSDIPQLHVPVRHNAFVLTYDYYCPIVQRNLVVDTHVVIGSLDLAIGLPKHTHTLCIEYVFQHPYLDIIYDNSSDDSHIMYGDMEFNDIIARYAKKQHYALFSEQRVLKT